MFCTILMQDIFQVLRGNIFHQCFLYNYIREIFKKITKKGLSRNGLTPYNYYGAEEGSRTPTGIHPLDPEPSASTSSATSALKWS